MTKATRLIVCTDCGAVNRSLEGRSLAKGKCGKCGSALASIKPKDLSAQIFAKLQAKDQGAYVLDVWAPWCGPCKMMAPAYEASAAKFDGKVRFLKLNSQEHPTAAQHLNIRGIPALFLFNKGKVVSQRSGALPESEITNWVEADVKLGPAYHSE